MTLVNIPETVHIPSAVLPAAGAFTSQAVRSLLQGQSKVTAVITYTRGASGGAPVFQPEWDFGTGVPEAQGTVIDSTIDTSTAGEGRQNLLPWQIPGPVSTSSAAMSYTLSFDAQEGATGFRLLAAEVGVTATPGTLEMWLGGDRTL